MTQALKSFDDDAEPFRLHYIRGAQKGVVSYDTLDRALEAAFKKLQKEQQLEVWISDAGKRVLLDVSQIRARMAQQTPGNAAAA